MNHQQFVFTIMIFIFCLYKSMILIIDETRFLKDILASCSLLTVVMGWCWSWNWWEWWRWCWSWWWWWRWWWRWSWFWNIWNFPGLQDHLCQTIKLVYDVINIHMMTMSTMVMPIYSTNFLLKMRFVIINFFIQNIHCHHCHHSTVIITIISVSSFT